MSFEFATAKTRERYLAAATAPEASERKDRKCPEERE